MSPAGFHTRGRVTPYLRIIGRFFYHILPLMTSHICVPDLLIGWAAKLHQDLISSPSSRDLIHYFSSLILGGSVEGESFLQSNLIIKSMLSFGFSVDVPRQVFQ